MPKFRTKPKEITAEQFNNGAPELAKGVCFCVAGDKVYYIAAHVHTMHNNQTVILESGDWVVPEPDGVHYYPIKPEVFADKYEPVASDTGDNNSSSPHAVSSST